jgi:hypothetical protein
MHSWLLLEIRKVEQNRLLGFFTMSDEKHHLCDFGEMRIEKILFIFPTFFEKIDKTY